MFFPQPQLLSIKKRCKTRWDSPIDKTLIPPQNSFPDVNLLHCTCRGHWSDKDNVQDTWQDLAQIETQEGSFKHEKLIIQPVLKHNWNKTTLQYVEPAVHFPHWTGKSDKEDCSQHSCVYCSGLFWFSPVNLVKVILHPAGNFCLWVDWSNTRHIY